MYIVNTSFIIEPEIHDRWYHFFITNIIPLLRGQGFNEPIFTRVLTDNSDGHHTYSLQVPVTDTAEYQRFVSQILGPYSEFAHPLFEQRALHFTSLLKRIEL